MASEIRVDTINPSVGVNTVTFPTNVSVGDTIITNCIVGTGLTSQTFWNGISTSILYLNNAAYVNNDDSNRVIYNSILGVGRSTVGDGYGNIFIVNSRQGKATTIALNQTNNASYKFEIPPENKVGSNLILSRYVSPSATHPSGQLWNDYVTFGYDGNVGIGTTIPGEKLQVDGNLRLGGSTTSNYIAFKGTTLDGQTSGQTPYSHTFIGERFYASTEQSELLLFKGNDSFSANIDRIRLAGGEIRFDTYASGSSLAGDFETVATSASLVTKAVVSTDGYLRLTTSSPGLQFNGDTAAANALNDYEEGTWTPTLPNGGTVTTYRASYTKIGRVVHVMGFLQTLSPTNNASELRIGGLPYTATSTASEYSLQGKLTYVSGTSPSPHLWSPTVPPANSYVYFIQQNASVTNGMWAVSGSNGGSMLFGVSYIV